MRITKGEMKAYKDSLQRRANELCYDSVTDYLNDDIQDFVVVFNTGGSLSGGVGIAYYTDIDEAYDDARELGAKVMMVNEWVESIGLAI